MPPIPFVASPPTPGGATIVAGSVAAKSAVMGISLGVDDYRGLTDNELEKLLDDSAEWVRFTSTHQAIVSGEIQRRSLAVYGSDGLAARKGWGTATNAVKILTGVSGPQAAKAVRTGVMIIDQHTAGSPDPDTGVKREAAEAWLAPVATALAAGLLGPDKADAIRRGLGSPTRGVSADALTSAAARLVAEAATLDLDRLFRLARHLRDTLDLDGVAAREDELRRRRSLKMFSLPDGMTRLVWEMDPETGAIVRETYDRITSPKLGGPHFQFTDEMHKVDAVRDDVRTSEQLASDGFVGLLQHGVTLDPSEVLGTGTPVVTVLTLDPILTAAITRFTSSAGADSGDRSADDLGTVVRSFLPAAHRFTPPGSDADTRTDTPDATAAPPDLFSDHEDLVECSCDGCTQDGQAKGGNTPTPPIPQPRIGWISGNQDSVSSETLQRLICTGGTIDVTIGSSGQPLDVGFEQRLFNRAQRRALGARDGGCRWVDSNGQASCDRPVSWTEAHHVEHWYRDGGATNIANGILLCKHHHLLLHNNHWEILRNGADYWLIPPIAVDIDRTPRPMPTHSKAMQALQPFLAPAG